MYFALVSYGLISFIYNKIFFLFPEAAMKIFNIQILTIVSGVAYFKIGSLIGLFLSIFRIEFRKFLISILSLLFLLNTFFILQLNGFLNFSLTSKQIFYSFRFFTGLVVTLLMSLYAQFISRFCNLSSHNTLINILFNGSVIIFPIWNLIYYFVPIKYLLPLVNGLVLCNIIYFFISYKSIGIQITRGHNKVLYPKSFINKDIIKKSYKVYLKYSGFIALFLFFLMTLLLVNAKMMFSPRPSSVIPDCLSSLLYQNIPYLISLIIFILHILLPQHARPSVLFKITLFLVAILNSNIRKYTCFPILILINSGLVYGLYILLSSVFIRKVKEDTKDLFHYGALLFYVIKTLMVGLLSKLFGCYLVNYMLLSQINYNLCLTLGMCTMYIIYLRFIYSENSCI